MLTLPFSSLIFKQVSDVRLVFLSALESTTYGLYQGVLAVCCTLGMLVSVCLPI